MKEIKGRGGAADIARRVMGTDTAVSSGYYTGHGQYTKAVDYTKEAQQLLARAGVWTVSGNSAPRGGVAGNWIRQATTKERATMKGRGLTPHATAPKGMVVAREIEINITCDRHIHPETGKLVRYVVYSDNGRPLYDHHYHPETGMRVRSVHYSANGQPWYDHHYHPKTGEHICTIRYQQEKDTVKK